MGKWPVCNRKKLITCKLKLLQSGRTHLSESNPVRCDIGKILDYRHIFSFNFGHLTKQKVYILVIYEYQGYLGDT